MDAAQCDVEIRTIAPDARASACSPRAHQPLGVARVHSSKPVFLNEGTSFLSSSMRDRKGLRGATEENFGQIATSISFASSRENHPRPEDSIEAEIHSDSDGEIVLELSNPSKVLAASPSASAIARQPSVFLQL